MYSQTIEYKYRALLYTKPKTYDKDRDIIL